jgi:alpha-tubulin suppressor-like RCC1 family protein
MRTNKKIMNCLIFLVMAVIATGCQDTDSRYRQTTPVPTPKPPQNDGPDGEPQDPTTPVQDPEPASTVPVFSVQPPIDLNLQEGQSATFDVSASGVIVSYVSQCLNSCPDSMSVTASGAFSWTPGFNDSGVYDVRFAATNDKGEVGVSQYVRLRVANVNRKPVVSSVRVQPEQPLQATTYSCDVTASDPDQGDVTQIVRRWVVNGVNPAGGILTTKTVTASQLGRAGDEIWCEVRARDLQNTVSDVVVSNKILMPNSSPVIISSGVVLSGSVSQRPVPETPWARVFKVGDKVRCAVSLIDNEGGVMTVPSMRLVAMPVSTTDGKLIPDLKDIPTGVDSFGTSAKLLMDSPGDLLSFTAVTPIEYLGMNLTDSGMYGVAYSQNEFQVTRTQAHRPLTCITTVVDGSLSVTAGNMVTRVMNSSPRVLTTSISAAPLPPNIQSSGSSSYTLRAGGVVRCTVEFEDQDDDVLVPTFNVYSTRGQTKRMRVSPLVSWSLSCLDQTRRCVATASYTTRRWTDISGDESLKATNSDIHSDVISCEAFVSDLTNFAPQTVSSVTSSLTIADSPPTIVKASAGGSVALGGGLFANGSLNQTIVTGQSYTPLTLIGSDPDGDAVQFSLVAAADRTYCENFGIASTIDVSHYPNAVVGQIGVTPAMTFPQKGRDCSYGVKAQSAESPSSVAMQSEPVVIMLNVPNRAPRLWCGTKGDAETILIQGESFFVGSNQMPDLLTRFLRSGGEDFFGRITSFGQGVGFDENDNLSNEEANYTSVVCIGHDPDGLLIGSSPATIQTPKETTSSFQDVFNWKILEVQNLASGGGGCSYQLADGVTSESLSSETFGSSENKRARRLKFSMGQKSCVVNVSISDGNLGDSQTMTSNTVKVTIRPKIEAQINALSINPYGYIEASVTSLITDSERTKFPTLSRGAVLLDGLSPQVTERSLPSSIKLTVSEGQVRRVFDEVRTQDNLITRKLMPVDFDDTFYRVSSSPKAFGFFALSQKADESSKSAYEKASGYVLEDTASGGVASKNLELQLSLFGAKKTTGEITTVRQVKRLLSVVASDVTANDLAASPRMPSFKVGTYGLDGAQVKRTKTCESAASCLGREASVASGEAHTCYVSHEGGVFCLGANLRGQLGATPSADQGVNGFDARGLTMPMVLTKSGACSSDYELSASCPLNGVDTDKIKAVTAGVAHSCALTDGGFILCWGDNTRGQLGVTENSLAAAGSPVFADVHAAADYVYKKSVNGNPERLQGVVQISAGPWHTCALTSDKKVYCWGSNPANSGHLTDGADEFCGSRRCLRSATEIPDMAGLIQISSGGFGTRLSLAGLAPGVSYEGGTTCGVSEVGSVFCFGDNLYGLRSTASTSSVPAMRVDPLARLSSLIEDYILGGDRLPAEPLPMSQAVMGVSVGPTTACALSFGSHYCWGGGLPGSIVNPFRTSSSGLESVGIADALDVSHVPISVRPLANTQPAYKGLGIGFSCEIYSEEPLRAGVRCLGNNHMLTGVGEQGVAASPSEMGALGSMSALAVVGYGAASPVRIPMLSGTTPLEDVVALSVGHFHACAVTFGGQVYCWGSNFAGQTGVGSSGLLSPVGYARLVATDAAVRRCGRVLRVGMQSSH